MRWSTYRSAAGDLRVALVEQDVLLGLAPGVTMIELLASGGEAMRQAADLARSSPRERIALEAADLCAPVPIPPSIRDFMSFEAHAVTSAEASGRTLSPTWYEAPAFYFSNPAASLGARDQVRIFPGSAAFDYELEIAAVIGSSASNVSPKEAGAHIAGYVLMSDWSARDIQARELQLGLGPVKAKDGAASFGPFVLTPDELEPRRRGKSFDLEMRCAVNGRPYSRGNLADLHWSFPQMLAYASRGTTLLPGDIIGSGTVGTGAILELGAVHGRDAFRWLRAGDVVEMEVDLLGTIRSTITDPPPTHDLE